MKGVLFSLRSNTKCNKGVNKNVFNELISLSLSLSLFYCLSESDVNLSKIVKHNFHHLFLQFNSEFKSGNETVVVSLNKNFQNNLTKTQLLANHDQRPVDPNLNGC